MPTENSMSPCSCDRKVRAGAALLSFFMGKPSLWCSVREGPSGMEEQTSAGWTTGAFTQKQRFARAHGKTNHLPRGDALWVAKSESASAFIFWDGRKYVWYQQSD